MNWDNLRYFLAVCRSGSVTGAGKALGVTHTTVARRIAGFERELGTRLFTRLRDGYVMTETAEAVFRELISLEERVIDIERVIFGRDTTLRGRLKLTAPEHLANVILAPTLPALRERYPELEVELLTTTSLLDLNTRQADVALRITRDPPEHLIGRRVSPLALGVYATEGYLERARERGEHHVITYPGDEPARVLGVSLPRAKAALRCDSPGTMRAAIRSGLGLGVLPCYYADVDPQLRRLAVPAASREWGVWLLNHVDLRGTARVQAVREFLTEVIEGAGALLRGERSRFASEALWVRE